MRNVYAYVQSHAFLQGDLLGYKFGAFNISYDATAVQRDCAKLRSQE